MTARGNPVKAAEPMKGNTVPVKNIEVDGSTGYAKELIRNGVDSGVKLVDDPIKDKLSVEDKVPTVEG